MKYLTSFTYQTLYRNCLWSACLHIAVYPRLSFTRFERSWSENTYCIQDFGMGTEGVIRFNEQSQTLIAAYRGPFSERVALYPSFFATSLFADAPESIRDERDKILDYMLVAMPGKPQFGIPEFYIPLVTTCLWSEADGICSCDDDTAFDANGGDYIRFVSRPFEQLRADLDEYYEPSQAETQCAERLFEAKLTEEKVLPSDAVVALDPAYTDCPAFWDAVRALGLIVS